MERFLSIVWDTPMVLAQPLVEAILPNLDNDDTVYAIFFNLYGNFFTPREEHAVLAILEHFIVVNMEHRETPTSWLRENSLFTRMFTCYAKCAHPSAPPPLCGA